MDIDVIVDNIPFFLGGLLLTFKLAVIAIIGCDG
jgi:hypothetical protein